MLSPTFQKELMLGAAPSIHRRKPQPKDKTIIKTKKIHPSSDFAPSDSDSGNDSTKSLSNAKDNKGGGGGDDDGSNKSFSGKMEDMESGGKPFIDTAFDETLEKGEGRGDSGTMTFTHTNPNHSANTPVIVVESPGSPMSPHVPGALSPPGVLLKQTALVQERERGSVFRVSPTHKIVERESNNQYNDNSILSSSSYSSTADRGISSGVDQIPFDFDLDLDPLKQGQGTVKEGVKEYSFMFSQSRNGKSVQEWDKKSNQFVDVEMQGGLVGTSESGSGHQTQTPRIDIDPDGKRKNNDVYNVYTGYTGDINKDGKRHGRGRCVYEKGDVYYGEWERNKRHGSGTFIYTNGDKYTGQFVKGKKSGTGDFIFRSSGDTYSGAFVGDVIHGEGIYRYKDGSVYEGNFVEGLKEGKGVQKYGSSAIYKGNWKHDQPNGKGKYTFPSGKIFKGRFLEGELHGSGMMKFPNSNQVFVAVFDSGQLISIEPMKIEKEVDGKEVIEPMKIEKEVDGKEVDEEKQEKQEKQEKDGRRGSGSKSISESMVVSEGTKPWAEAKRSSARWDVEEKE